MMYKESDFIALIITLSILNFAGKRNDVNVVLDWDSWVRRDLPPEMYVARPQIFFFISWKSQGFPETSHTKRQIWISPF